ncbi:hypothetical protein EGW08_018994 [Elysia chlorotica]|uniref:C2H2-type domain-containing protein n=1 Tax=Elysia chlorotica TaxID=188477 RepID=A0A433SVC4_ELYCH|nr:hypothetical protein EGW08_018994 [Elysia chlorotica]
MEEGSSFDVKPDVTYFFHSQNEKSDIKVLYVNEKPSSLSREEIQDTQSSDARLNIGNIFPGLTAENYLNLVTYSDGIKVEPNKTDFNTMDHEKLCIAALRASVEEYSARQTLDGKNSTPREGLSDVYSVLPQDERDHTVLKPPVAAAQEMHGGGAVPRLSLPSYCDRYLDPQEQVVCLHQKTVQDHPLNIDQLHCQSIVWREKFSNSKCAKTYKCEQCGKVFLKKSDLARHKPSHSSEKPYKCEECGMSFSYKESLKRHNQIHTKPYMCEYCGKRFLKKSDLTSHKQIHTFKKPYMCEYCGKCCSAFQHLTKHIRTHTFEKPYKCEICAKCFSDQSNLVKHKRTHSHTFGMPYNYKCEDCGKHFLNKSHLTSHKRTHTFGKSCKCEDCGKCFSNKSYLSKHKRIHTFKYRCDYCGKCFPAFSNLARHVRLHTFEKPYKCDNCGKCFSDKSNLVSHIRTHLFGKVFIKKI